jgi:K+-transporting ATPase KdpF subunit
VRGHIPLYGWHRKAEGTEMMYLVMGLIVLALLVYVFAALLFPEKF